MKHPLLFLIAIGLFVVVIVPLWLALMAAMGFMLPVFIIACVGWLALGSKRRSRRHRLGRSHWSSQAIPGKQPWRVEPFGPRPVMPLQSLQPAEADLPIDVKVKVEQIRRKVEVLLGYASRFPPFSQDLYLVRQTATDYLPRTLRAFRALPPDAVDRVIPLTGLTAAQELRQQLDLLDRKLDDIADDLQSQDFDRLLANRRFLEERFGRQTV